MEEVTEALQSPPTPHPYSLLTPRTVAEFFAGIGLMRAGLEPGGWRVVFANDIDPRKQQMYDAHFVDDQERFVVGDIHQVQANGVPIVSLATASFPQWNIRSLPDPEEEDAKLEGISRFD